MNKTTPNPGSLEAEQEGCTCPVIDNRHGKGTTAYSKDGETNFWIDGGCPLHGAKAQDEYLEEA